MEDVLFVSWFYSGKYFDQLIKSMLNSGSPCVALKSLYKKHHLEIIRLKKKTLKAGAQAITYLSPLYPESLKEVDFPPWVLSVYGNIDLLGRKKALGIVGSRRPDLNALRWLKEEIVKIDKSVVVVSGGAIGIDQAVHREACKARVSNICVLPVGIFEIYPLSLRRSLKGYFKTGKFLLVSQFHPERKICRSLFHPRNYLLSGLSKKVLVIQAEIKSGTMVTAKYALEQGRDLYVLPAALWDERFSGNVKLLEEGAYQIIELSLIHL